MWAPALEPGQGPRAATSTYPVWGRARGQAGVQLRGRRRRGESLWARQGGLCPGETITQAVLGRGCRRPLCVAWFTRQRKGFSFHVFDVTCRKLAKPLGSTDPSLSAPL